MLERSIVGEGRCAFGPVASRYMIEAIKIEIDINLLSLNGLLSYIWLGQSKWRHAHVGYVRGLCASAAPDDANADEVRLADL